MAETSRNRPGLLVGTAPRQEWAWSVNGAKGPLGLFSQGPCLFMGPAPQLLAHPSHLRGSPGATILYHDILMGPRVGTWPILSWGLS